MERRQRNIAFEMGQNLIIDEDRPVVLRTAMRDAMPHCDRLQLLGIAQPRPRGLERGSDVAYLLRSIGLIDQG